MSQTIQQRVQGILDELVAEGNDRGLQAGAYYQGRLVVDASAGVMDAQSGRPVDGQTLFPMYSTGKGIASTAVHRLVERGVLDYDRPIAADWPAFAAQGKGDITLRHAMNHTSGMWALPRFAHMHALCDWDGVCEALAGMAAATPPGQETRYHAVSYGWLLGEPARRATGKPFDALIRELVTEPLGITDEMFFGIGEAQASRVVTLERAEPFELPEEENLAIPHMIQPLEAFMNDPAIQRSCNPASCGIMTARAVARHYAALLPGGVDGVELLRPETAEAARRLNRPDPSVPIAEMAGRFGLGYVLRGPDEDPSQIFGHGGYGGMAGFIDVKRGLTLGLAKNRTGTPRAASELVLEALQAWVDAGAR